MFTIVIFIFYLLIALSLLSSLLVDVVTHVFIIYVTEISSPCNNLLMCINLDKLAFVFLTLKISTLKFAVQLEKEKTLRGRDLQANVAW